MKKSLLSIVLSLAILVTAFGTMLVMPASAANGRDFLTEGSISLSDGAADAGATAEIVDGKLVFTATAAGQEVSLTIEGEANMNDYPYWELTLESDIQWNACLYNANDSKWMFANGDWYNQFVGGVNTQAPINAGSEDVKINVTGCYTWTGAPLPANAAVKSATFIAQGAGTITVSKCAMTDGMEDHSLNTGSYSSLDQWEAETISLLAPVDAWGSKDVNGSSATVTADGDNLVIGNTAGGWPSACVNFVRPYVVNVNKTALFADFTVKQATTVYLYLNGATAEQESYADDQFVAITPVGFAAEVSTGNYTGIQYLSDIIPASAVAADGTVAISAVSVFATGSAGECVTVKALDLLTAADVEVGDVDMDNDIDTYDALLVYTASAQQITLTEEQQARADIDGDGIITIDDAKLAFCAAAGIDLADLGA